MRVDMSEIVAWQVRAIGRLIAACRQDEEAPIDRAAAAVKLSASSQTGFTIRDLVYFRSVILDRADQLEAGRIVPLARKLERAERFAQSCTKRVREIGGTVSRQEFARYRVEAKRAEEEVALVKAILDDETTEAEAHRGAAALIAEIIDMRTCPHVRAVRSPEVVVAA